jgi:hypothetical protein
MELIRYEHAKRAIAEYKTVDEVKDFRDKALAVEAYAKQAKDYELEHDASIARVRAERKAGILLAEMEMAKGGNPEQIAKSNRLNGATGSKPKTLSEMGITKDQSSKWQQLGRVPEKEFEKAVSLPAKDEDGNRNKVTANKVLNPDFPTEQKKKMNPHALWWWGTLTRLEKDGRFSLSVNELLSEMTDAMRSDSEPLFIKLKEYLNANK